MLINFIIYFVYQPKILQALQNQSNSSKFKHSINFENPLRCSSKDHNQFKHVVLLSQNNIEIYSYQQFYSINRN
jgi:hypothetical protein